MRFRVLMVGCNKESAYYKFGGDGPEEVMWKYGISGKSYSNITSVGFCLFDEVATVEADDLNEVFALMNHWGEPDRVEVNEGFGVRSLSVGDLIIDEAGMTHAVAPHGFEELPNWKR